MLVYYKIINALRQSYLKLQRIAKPSHHQDVGMIYACLKRSIIDGVLLVFRLPIYGYKGSS
jgi:hypothetical protein